MPTINQLPVLTVVSPGDQLPVYSPNNGDARRTSIGSLLLFFQQSFASPSLSTSVYTPGTGFNITVPTPVSQQQWMLIQPVSTLATGTVTFPLNTQTPDGTEVLITTTQTITAFTIAINGAAAIYGNINTLPQGTAVRFRFYQSSNSWYNISSNDFLALTGPIQTFLGDPTSANLAAAVTDETGSGSLVFATSPTLVTPQIGAATGTSLTTTGRVASTGTAGVGYATGAGGTVPQEGSRTDSVTINKITGAITLYNDAGSATAASFTVNNSTVSATDVVILSQKSGTDKYDLMVTAVGAGSFEITYRTTGGTTTEQPVINFAVIKGVAA